MAEPRVLGVPALSLVVLVGASGSGKSSFARKHFRPTEVLSSDTCRGLVCDDETSLEASKDAFDVVRYVAAKRLARGLLTVIDATNVHAEARAPFVALAREYHCLPVAIVLDVPERVCQERNAGRPGRDFGPHVVRNHAAALRRSLRGLEREGFRTVHHLEGVEQVDAAVIRRDRLWNDRRDDLGPFDVIGDVHGCLAELLALLAKLGYSVTRGVADDGGARFDVVPPAGRKAVFLGDLVDRGPDSPGVLRLVMDMCAAGAALAVPGNHDVKLVRKLRGRDVKLTHGLAETVAQLALETPAFAARAETFLDGLVSHYVLDGGRLVVAHAGLREDLHGRGSGKVREFALYGDTTGETDEYGLPVRYPWANDYRGAAHVVYGHTPVVAAEWLNRTICIDTGCVFGGRLTALRWPEKEIVSVPAEREYYAPTKPLGGAPGSGLSAQHENDDVLDLDDVAGRRIVSTRLRGNVTLREEQTLPALEVMSRFAANPKWIAYLPPTMSPPETSSRDGLLEHADEALAYYRSLGVGRVVCEEKHMGSRAVVVVCRDAGAAARRFGVADGTTGAVLTRTGRPFFQDVPDSEALLARVRAAAEAAGLWDSLSTDWAILDAELMPWSAKAQSMIRDQYAAVGAAARSGLGPAESALAAAAARGADVAALLARVRERRDAADRYHDAYGRYCWPVTSVADLRLAPFQILATEGRVHAETDHLWHLAALAPLAQHDPVIVATRHVVADLGDDASCAAAVAWWTDLTSRGGEGMVVKPLPHESGFPPSDARMQPAVKCRGPEYLRIIYGPDYARPEHLARLRRRGLAPKRSLALREHALGIEALERFVRREPLRRVHECVFAVLALETEPVDPRL